MKVTEFIIHLYSFGWPECGIEVTAGWGEKTEQSCEK